MKDEVKTRAQELACKIASNLHLANSRDNNIDILYPDHAYDYNNSKDSNYDPDDAWDRSSENSHCSPPYSNGKNVAFENSSDTGHSDKNFLAGVDCGNSMSDKIDKKDHGSNRSNADNDHVKNNHYEDNDKDNNNTENSEI